MLSLGQAQWLIDFMRHLPGAENQQHGLQVPQASQDAYYGASGPSSNYSDYDHSTNGDSGYSGYSGYQDYESE